MRENTEYVLVAMVIAAVGVAFIRRGKRKREEERNRLLSVAERLGFWSGYQMLMRGWLLLVGAIVLGIWGVCR